MFTGIIEATGVVQEKNSVGSNIEFILSCPFSRELKIDQSVAHNGCCLTVIDIWDDKYRVAAIRETLEKTNLRDWDKGTHVNLERCLKLADRLDGHLVQGHVDQTGIVQNIENKNGSHVFTIRHSEAGGFITVPQGSIAVNGISLTVAESGSGRFSVAIIPYTYENTNMNSLKINDTVNLEFDIIGKYVAKLMTKNAIF